VTADTLYAAHSQDVNGADSVPLRSSGASQHAAGPSLPRENMHSPHVLFHSPYALAAVSYDRGILEEVTIYSEIFVTKLFAALRVVLRILLLLPPGGKLNHSTSHRKSQRRSSFQSTVRPYRRLMVVHGAHVVGKLRPQIVFPALK
jgi:hypothetical protein